MTTYRVSNPLTPTDAAVDVLAALAAVAAVAAQPRAGQPRRDRAHARGPPERQGPAERSAGGLHRTLGGVDEMDTHIFEETFGTHEDR